MKTAHSWTNARTQSTRGFTLIELLVVIAIIAIGRHAPAGAGSRQGQPNRSSASATCAKSGWAWRYRDDHDGRFPATRCPQWRARRASVGRTSSLFTCKTWTYRSPQLRPEELAFMNKPFAHAPGAVETPG